MAGIMDKALQKLQKMVDDIALLKEEVSTNKIKVVKLERKLKESQDKIERLESEKTTTVKDPKSHKTGSMTKEFAALKKQCEDVNNKCQRLTKLQHILNSFILKSRDSCEWQTGIESLRNDFSKLSETVTELQTAFTSFQKSTTPDLARPGACACRTYFSSICREVTIVQESGILMYTSQSSSVPVGQYISEKPLTSDCPSFSFVIISPGKDCAIAIGVCPRGYPANRQPGWNSGSVAYHADDGGIFCGSGATMGKSDLCTVGDVMKCQVDFSNNNVMFFRNGTKVFSLRLGGRSIPTLNAAVGMHSPGEVIMLLEKKPWRM